MLTLTKQKAKLNNVNLRSEFQGTDRRLAADLKFTVEAPNAILDQFSPELRAAFYKSNEGQKQTELLPADSALRFPQMGGAFKWEQHFHGYTARIDHGIGGESDITLGDCKVNGFAFLPKDGGTVTMEFRVQCHPGDDDVLPLAQHIQDDVSLTLTPPAPVADLVTQEPAPGVELSGV